MQHILRADQFEFHDIDEDSSSCSCNPRVIIDKVSGEMFVIHNHDTPITEDDVKGLLAFVNDDPEYEGGNLIIHEDE